MPIRFSIAKRGSLPTEELQQNLSQEVDLGSLRILLDSPTTVDAVEFQSSSLRLPSVLPKAELMAALGTLQRVMVHELKQGNAVSLPGIGTFRLSLKGGIEETSINIQGVYIVQSADGRFIKKLAVVCTDPYLKVPGISNCITCNSTIIYAIKYNS